MDGNAAMGIPHFPSMYSLQAQERAVTSVQLKELVKCPAASYK